MKKVLGLSEYLLISEFLMNIMEYHGNVMEYHGHIIEISWKYFDF